MLWVLSWPVDLDLSARRGWLWAQRRCSRPVPALCFHSDSSVEKACTGEGKKSARCVFPVPSVVELFDWQRRQRLGPAGTPKDPRALSRTALQRSVWELTHGLTCVRDHAMLINNWLFRLCDDAIFVGVNGRMRRNSRVNDRSFRVVMKQLHQSEGFYCDACFFFFSFAANVVSVQLCTCCE